MTQPGPRIPDSARSSESLSGVAAALSPWPSSPGLLCLGRRRRAAVTVARAGHGFYHDFSILDHIRYYKIRSIRLFIARAGH